MNNFTTSEQGIDLIVQREGLRTEAYQDIVGVWTIGVGHTGDGVGPGVVWTVEKAKSVLQMDLAGCEAAINADVEVELVQNQFDALVSFTFNVGIPAFESSTLLRLLNAGDFGGAAEQFDRWHIPAGITSRRMGEKAQFMGTAFEARINEAVA